MHPRLGSARAVVARKGEPRETIASYERTSSRPALEQRYTITTLDRGRGIYRAK